MYLCTTAAWSKSISLLCVSCVVLDVPCSGRCGNRPWPTAGWVEFLNALTLLIVQQDHLLCSPQRSMQYEIPWPNWISLPPNTEIVTPHYWERGSSQPQTTTLPPLPPLIWWLGSVFFCSIDPPMPTSFYSICDTPCLMPSPGRSGFLRPSSFSSTLGSLGDATSRAVNVPVYPPATTTTDIAMKWVSLQSDHAEVNFGGTVLFRYPPMLSIWELVCKKWQCVFLVIARKAISAVCFCCCLPKL